MELANPGSAEPDGWWCWLACPAACVLLCGAVGHFIGGVTAHVVIHAEEAR